MSLVWQLTCVGNNIWGFCWWNTDISMFQDGNSCAHIAAMQGSIRVIEELMKFDRQGVISARNRITEATPLQLAAEGGHAEVVKALVRAGASCTDENKVQTGCFICWDQLLVGKGFVCCVNCGLLLLHVLMKIRYVEVVSLFGIDCWLASSSFISSTVGFIM
jgi:Ankyrin repeat.